MINLDPIIECFFSAAFNYYFLFFTFSITAQLLEHLKQKIPEVKKLDTK